MSAQDSAHLTCRPTTRMKNMLMAEYNSVISIHGTSRRGAPIKGGTFEYDCMKRDIRRNVLMVSAEWEYGKREKWTKKGRFW